jgi:hypothetical protein
MRPDIFADAIARCQQLALLPQWSEAWAWPGPFRDSALEWARAWNLGDADHVEFAYTVFKFADLEARLQVGTAPDGNMLRILQTMALGPLGWVPGAPWSYGADDAWTFVPYSPEAETHEEYMIRWRTFKRRVESHAQRMTDQMRGSGATATIALARDEHYRWFIRHRVLNEPQEEIRVDARVTQQAVSRAVCAIADLVQLPRHSRPGRTITSVILNEAA